MEYRSEARICHESPERRGEGNYGHRPEWSKRRQKTVPRSGSVSMGMMASRPPFHLFRFVPLTSSEWGSVRGSPFTALREGRRGRPSGC